mmetsp:Transcript_116974/g.342573  ORF Transcript_116974/g.342573 Transcript_116974/m.342573 type:complete len:224 (+) Transcript_116974:996-1667(+)
MDREVPEVLPALEFVDPLRWVPVPRLELHREHGSEPREQLGRGRQRHRFLRVQPASRPALNFTLEHQLAPGGLELVVLSLPQRLPRVQLVVEEVDRTGRGLAHHGVDGLGFGIREDGVQRALSGPERPQRFGFGVRLGAVLGERSSGQLTISIWQLTVRQGLQGGAAYFGPTALQCAEGALAAARPCIVALVISRLRPRLLGRCRGSGDAGGSPEEREQREHR